MTEIPEKSAKVTRQHSFLAQPVSRILLAGFLLVALVPVGFLGYKLYKLAWEDAWREISGPLLDEYCNSYAAGYSAQKTAVKLQNLIWDRKE